MDAYTESPTEKWVKYDDQRIIRRQEIYKKKKSAQSEKLAGDVSHEEGNVSTSRT